MRISVIVALGFAGLVAAACESAALETPSPEAGGAPLDAGSEAASMGGAAGEAPATSACLGAAGSPTAGKGCGCDRDCDGEEVCIPELPGAARPDNYGWAGGYCVHTCFLDAPCPEGFACLERTPGDEATRVCMELCATTGDCRPGYVCEPELSAATPLHCTPLCQDDSDCPLAGHCNRYTGGCDTSTPSVNDVGDACSAHSECESGLCVMGSAMFPGGYCTAYCSLSRQGCPTGSGCALRAGSSGDKGNCLKSCESTSDCRQGYICGESPIVPGLRACGPGAG